MCVFRHMVKNEHGAHKVFDAYGGTITARFMALIDDLTVQQRSSPFPSKGRSVQMARPKVRSPGSLKERFLGEANKKETDALQLPPGMLRDQILREARQMRVTADLENWMSSPGLQKRGDPRNVAAQSFYEFVVDAMLGATTIRKTFTGPRAFVAKD